MFKTNTLLFFILAFWGCKTNKPIVVDRPISQQSIKKINTPSSILSIPISITNKNIESLINENLPQIIFEDNSFEDNNYDGLKYKITKKENVTVLIDNNKITSTIPLIIDISVSKWGIEKSVQVIADMKLSTSFDLKEDWSFKSKTTLVDFVIMNDPVLQLGFFEVSIKSYIKTFLNHSKNIVENTIDEQLISLFPSRVQLNSYWSILHQPFLLNQDYGMWLGIKPSQLKIVPINANNNVLTSQLNIKTNIDVAIGSKPIASNAPPLPNFIYSPAGDNKFELQIGTTINYSEANSILAQNFVGFVHYYKKRKFIKITDIEVYANGDNLVCGVTFEGNLKGKIYLFGIPVYNPSTQKIEISNLQFDTKTKNILVKSAEILLKGTLRNKLQELASFSVADQLNTTEALINDSFKSNSLSKNIKLNCKLFKIEPKEIAVTPNYLSLIIGVEGESKIEVGVFKK